MIALVFSNSKRYFLLGWECLILGKEGWKNRDKTEKMPYFPDFRETIFQVAPQTLEYSLSHISDPYDSPPLISEFG